MPGQRPGRVRASRAGGDILDTVNARDVRWGMVFLALLCLLPAGWGALWALSGEEGAQAFGLALLGFFGAGTVVLLKQAIRR